MHQFIHIKLPTCNSNCLPTGTLLILIRSPALTPLISTSLTTLFKRNCEFNLKRASGGLNFSLGVTDRVDYG